mgnify:FL=1
MFSKNNNFKFIFFTLFILIFNCNSYSSADFNYFSFIKSLNSFSASFKQNTYQNDGSLLSESNGNLIYKKKAKYILEYENPSKIKFVSDGQFITTYDEELEQVIIQSYKNTFKENIIDIMTNEVLIKEKFTLKSYIKGNDYYIKFIPLKSDIEDNIFLLVINNNRIKEISFMNDFEQSVIMKFKDFKNNVSVVDSLFKIDIPKNFDVIVDK